MAQSVERILVVGAGIGGLATATALARRGMTVTVAERRARFVDSGVGLGQPANALRVLREIGLLDDVLAAGFEFEHFKVYDHQRSLIVDHRFRMGGDGVPAIAALRRQDIHRLLLAAAADAGCEIRLGTEPVAAENRPDSVEVELSDGSSEKFDVLVGFDGLTSWTRRQLYGSRFDPVPSGSAAWRLIVPRPADVTCMEFYQGLGHKTGVMPLNEAEMYLFHIRREHGVRRHDPGSLHLLLRERLEGYGGVAAEVREQLSAESRVTYSPLDPLFVEEPWYRGRIAFGGDAAHTYPPHMTQGAAMALEDGIALADELGRDDAPLDERLAAYVARRRARCRFVFDFATRMLQDEQSIRTAADLERARSSGFGDLDSRLSSGDRVMDDYMPTAAPSS